MVLREFTNAFSVGIMAWLGGRSSFYMDCDAFNTSATAPRRGTEMFLEEEGLGTRNLHLVAKACTSARFRQ